MALLLKAQEIKADGSRLRAFRPNAMADRLLRIVRHQAFELGFGSLMLEVSIAGANEDIGEFAPGIRAAHVDYMDGLNARSRWVYTEESRRFTCLDATPELALGRDDEMLVEGIRVCGDLYPFAAARDDRQGRGAGCDHPHIVLQLRHILRQGGFLRERPRK